MNWLRRNWGWPVAGIVLAAIVLQFEIWDGIQSLANPEDRAPEAAATPVATDPFEALGIKTFDEMAEESGIRLACEWAIGWLSVEGDLRDAEAFFSDIETYDAEELRGKRLRLAIVLEADRWLDRNGAKC